MEVSALQEGNTELFLLSLKSDIFLMAMVLHGDKSCKYQTDCCMY